MNGLDMTEQSWKDEQNRVNHVVEVIDKRIKGLEREVGSVRTDVVEMRRDFWDDVTINFSEADDVGETSTSLRQQSEVLSERERSHKHSFAALSKMKRLRQSPYFGRIDFAETGEPAEQIYLGIASLLDQDDQTFLVYDWRAPISNLYYDSTPGPASYKTPVGEIAGEMLLKRQFVIRDSQIKLMFDTGVTIGDELLQEVLGRSSDAQMKSIVATIQREQNRIIRNERSRMLIVQGAAGSGKTSAALQRVAYLLYKYREHLQADQVILFSPNPMFNSYVSTVLPELGEENMQQTTFQEYLEHRIGREFQLEDPFVQMEYVLSGESGQPGYDARIEAIRYKSSSLYIQAMNGYRNMLLAEGMLFRPLRFQGKEIVGREEISKRFYAYDSSITLANRCDLLREWLLKELADFSKREVNEPWVEEQMQLLDSEDYQIAYQRMRRQNRKKNRTFTDYEDEKLILARMVVSDRLKPLRKWVKALRFVDIKGLYAQLFANKSIMLQASGGDLPASWDEICRFTLDNLEKGELAYEDATPYLYLREQLLGFRSNGNIRHVFIDEAQDYSPFQLFFLKRLFPRARMTALGDLNQAIYAHGSILQQTSTLSQLYGQEETEQITLTQSYRSTRQIVDFTRQMVEGGERIVPFNRDGELPEIRIAGEQAALNAALSADLDQLKAEGYETIAIICKTAEESRLTYETLKKDHELKLIKKTTLSFEKGIHVIPAYLAKGVEFDAVLIYDASEERYRRESERKLFYTACTRAMHLLHVYSLGEPSPFIKAVKPEDYRTVELETSRVNG
ncbi:RNA polymerase recycling motor HelD [Paenibacillus physcomitrellae]|uniref:DNA helicase n=1 Tax=Paenibacillus physcomitrellae TaxID=1619311 RepID=A0ABQ1GBD6_9BACL|nr:RNA polymerase recycling motor HelD [Paenibacillus physcomitrellae]GGA40226.1 DNA helicase [Paenibacillus physcomitrellae]